MTYSDATTNDLLQKVRELQAVQKQNMPNTDIWQQASTRLAPIFAELATRQLSAPIGFYLDE